MNKEIGVLGGKIDKLQKENEQTAALDTKLKASQSELNKLTKQRNEEQSKYKRNLSDGSKQLQKEKEALEYKLKISKTENEKLNGLNVKYKHTY